MEKDNFGIEKPLSKTRTRFLARGTGCPGIRLSRCSERSWSCPFCDYLFDTVEECSHHEQTIHPNSNSKEDEQRFWDEDSSPGSQWRSYAESALRYFNTKEGPGGKRYELVEHGPAIAEHQLSDFIHVNFKAKEVDCPSAQVETFFAQVRIKPYSMVQCCVSLGPSHELPHWSKAYLGGCTCCFGYVNHPTEMIDGVYLGNYMLHKEDDTDVEDEDDEDEDEDEDDTEDEDEDD